MIPLSKTLQDLSKALEESEIKYSSLKSTW